MRGLRYAVCSAVFGFVLVAVIVELGVYMENVRTRRKAEALLRAVTQFQVGESPFLATRQTLIQFGARKRGHLSSLRIIAGRRLSIASIRF